MSIPNSLQRDANFVAVGGGVLDDGSGAIKPILINSSTGRLKVTATVSGGGGIVTQIIAGTNITISPVGGTGAVTINATGGGSGTWYQDEVPSGTKNGVNTSFTLAHSPVSVVFLHLNGQYLTSGGVDYTRSGTSITMVTAPLSTDTFTASYS